MPIGLAEADKCNGDFSPTMPRRFFRFDRDAGCSIIGRQGHSSWLPQFIVEGSNVNLSRVPDRTADEVCVLVESEMRRIANAGILQGIQTFLIKPRLEMRTWGWAKTPAAYPVWIVAESSRYDYGIAFSDYGFAPEHSWGLVFLSHSDFDADYCWYSTLEDAYTMSDVFFEMRICDTPASLHL